MLLGHNASRVSKASVLERDRASGPFQLELQALLSWFKISFFEFISLVQVIWIMKLVSRLSVAMGGHILPDSHLYLPPHLCSSCCATGRGRLPVVVVRNPFSRLASNWRALFALTQAYCVV